MECLQDQNGEWVTDCNALESMSRTFFQNLYTDKAGEKSFILKGRFPQLQPHNVDELRQPVSDHEIKKAIFNIGGFKALGNDSIQAIFYQS